MNSVLSISGPGLLEIHPDHRRVVMFQVGGSPDLTQSAGFVVAEPPVIKEAVKAGVARLHVLPGVDIPVGVKQHKERMALIEVVGYDFGNSAGWPVSAERHGKSAIKK